VLNLLIAYFAIVAVVILAREMRAWERRDHERLLIEQTAHYFMISITAERDAIIEGMFNTGVRQ